jgi:haloalkane dehalogenase
VGNIIPALSENNRVIGIDMIGMGQSDKPDITYRFDDHAAFMDAALAELGLRDVTLVAHDWGGAIALDYAARHPSNVRGIALLEAVIRPMTRNDANFVERFMFGQLRDPVLGPRLSGDENYFIEKMIPMMTGRRLTDAEMAAYNAPYPTRETRLPVWQWPVEIPIDGTPADNAERIGANYAWLRQSDVPVLLLAASPGTIIKTPFVAGLQSDIPRLEVRSIGPGLHYIQETNPRRIGAELADWISTN